MNKTIKFKNNLILKRVIFLTLLLIIFYIIFGFSSQDGEESGTISHKVTVFIIDIFNKDIDYELKLNYITKLEPIIRKIAHFSIYTVVGFSMMGFMCTFDMKNVLKISISSFVGLIYAISDEIHQSFTPGRSPRLFDVGIDFLGVLNGIIIIIILIILIEKISDFLKNKSLIQNNWQFSENVLK